MCRVEKKIGWPCREIAFGRHIAFDKKLAVNGRGRARKRTDDICSRLTLITLACQHSPLAVATSSGEVRLKKQVMDLWCAKKNRFNYVKQFYRVVYLLLIHRVLQQKKVISGSMKWQIIVGKGSIKNLPLTGLVLPSLGPWIHLLCRGNETGWWRSETIPIG